MFMPEWSIGRLFCNCCKETCIYAGHLTKICSWTVYNTQSLIVYIWVKANGEFWQTSGPYWLFAWGTTDELFFNSTQGGMSILLACRLMINLLVCCFIILYRMERDAHGPGNNPLVCHCVIGNIIPVLLACQAGWKYFMFKTLEDPPANKILMQCNMPHSSVWEFFSQISFYTTLQWLKRKYIKQVLK